MNLLVRLLQDVAIERGPGALALLRDADAGCLRLTCFHLDLDLSLRTAIDVVEVQLRKKGGRQLCMQTSQ